MLFSRSDIGQILEKQLDSVNGQRRDSKNISYKAIVSIKNDWENFRRLSNLLVIARMLRIFLSKRLDDSLISSPAIVRVLHSSGNLIHEIRGVVEDPESSSG